jgi:hypothetical protein
MGNTKYIWFTGEAKKESKDAFGGGELREQVGARYVAVTIDPRGYLPSSLASNKDRKTDMFVIGIIHSYSMTALHVVDYLKTHLTSGTIGYLDVDMPAMRIETFCDNGQWEVVENRVAGDLPQFSPFA